MQDVFLGAIPLRTWQRGPGHQGVVAPQRHFPSNRQLAARNLSAVGPAVPAAVPDRQLQGAPRVGNALRAHLCSYAAIMGTLVLLLWTSPASAKTNRIESNPFTNIPDALTAPVDKVRELGHFLTGANGRVVESCTRTCLPACLRGGQGAPGLGPLSMRREIIVFKDGYRTRKYCLSECTQVCALISSDQTAEIKGQK